MKTVQQQFDEVFNSDYSKGVRDCLDGKPEIKTEDEKREKMNDDRNRNELRTLA